jgi:poly(A) polymerase
MTSLAKVRDVVRVLRDAGYEALVAGGSVRDHLLGREPKDHDVATSARPEDIELLFARTVPVGAAFGVMLVIVEGEAFEVATFRADGPYEDGRRPQSVTYSDAREDSRRRDFTVNGLFLDPFTGEILDYVGGRADIEARVIRAIGRPEDRFAEDRLRLLRAIRFASTLDFEIEQATYEALKQAAGAIVEVSRERIRDELTRILTGGGAACGFRLLRDSGLLRAVLPEVADMDGIEQPEVFHPEGDVWEHTLAVLEGLDQMDAPSMEVAWAALLHDVGKPPTMTREDRIRFNDHARVGADMAEEICRGLRMSKAEALQIRDLVAQHMTFMDVQKMRDGRLRRFLTQENVEDHLRLHRLDCVASHGGLENHDFCRERMERIELEPEPPAYLLSGRDLIAAGYAPGPRFADILRCVEEAHLDGDIETRDEALLLVAERFGAPEEAESE